MSLLLRMAWRNLLRGWRRSAIVLTAIAVGLSACFAIIAWAGGLYRNMVETAVQTHLAHLAVHAPGYHANPSVDLNLSDGGAAVLAALRGRAGARASARLVGDGLVQSARRNVRAAIVGVDPALEPGVSVVPHALVRGRYLLAETARGRARQLPGVVIGGEMAERLRVDVGDKLVLRVPGEAGLGAFRVRGIYRTNSSAFDRSFAYVALRDAQSLFALDRSATEVAIMLDEPEALEDFQSWLQHRLRGGPPVEVLRWDEREPRLATMLSLMDETSWIFYAVIFVAMAFGIANALLMAVYERVREFGVMRALGLRARRVLELVLLESLLLTLAGCALGLGIAIPLVLWLGEVGIDLGMFSDALGELGIATRIHPTVRARDLWTPVALAVITALLAGLWPAIRAARMRPAEAMRHV